MINQYKDEPTNNVKSRFQNSMKKMLRGLTVQIIQIAPNSVPHYQKVKKKKGVNVNKIEICVQLWKKKLENAVT